MWTRAELKATAKVNFKSNYWKSVAAFLIFSFFTAVGITSSGGDDTAKELVYSIKHAAWPRASAFLAGLFISLIILALIDIVLTNIVTVGYKRFLLDNTNEGEKGRLGSLFEYFKKSFFSLAGKMFITDLFVCLWSLLLIVPGIVKSYQYYMVPFLLAENPELSGEEVRARSKAMMDGHKMNAFVLDLSFIGWEILSACTCGILQIFYVGPYIYQTKCELYKKLKG